MTTPDPNKPYQINVHIPDTQKQALYQALMTVVTVVLGITATLVAQYVGQAMDVPVEPATAVSAPASSTFTIDPLQSLGGTTHFADLDIEGNVALDGALDVGAGITVDVGDENIGLPSIISTPITYTAAAGGTGAIATIADGEVWVIHSVFVHVTTSFACTGDDAILLIGDGNDTDGFIVAADANLQTTFTEATGYPAGWYGLENGSNGAYTVDEGLFLYAPSGAAETIDYTVDETSGDSLTAGAATVYVVYTRIQ